MENLIRKATLKEFLETKVVQYNSLTFISSDPVQIPHLFEQKEDIEIAAFLTSSIAWGQRTTIIKNAFRLMELMSMHPYRFINSFEENDFEPFIKFVHRTFNGFDCIYFIKALQKIYLNFGSLEKVFLDGYNKYGSVYGALKVFREVFFSYAFPGKTSRHVSDVTSNSAAKRLNLFLRWMVRNDSKGVDFGIWKNISPADLMIPLDLHSGRIARELGLLKRKQDDWKAVEELTTSLKTFDIQDPVKYDYALFGIGVFEKN